MPDSHLVPTGKWDLAAAQRTVEAGWPEVQPVVRDLIGWCVDLNWPVAKIIGPFLGGLGAAIQTEVSEFLRGDDDCGKYHIFAVLISHMPLSGLAALEDDLRRLAEEPTASESGEVPELASEELARLRRGE
jgi:hypothetical protein